MEGVTRINQKIMKEAIAEANKIVSEAKEKAAETMREETEKTDVEKNIIQEDGKKCAKREEQRILSSASLEAHNLMLESRDKLIHTAISKAETQMKKMSRDNTGQYKKALKAMAEEGIIAIGEDSTLHFNTENTAPGKEIAKELGVKTGDVKEIIGGVIVESSSGELRIDNSIERIMERESEKIRGKVAEILFKTK